MTVFLAGAPMEEAASQLEKDHVHSVYEKVAPYFSDSRYKAWPKVRQFLLEQEPGSIIADVGCGNGRYLHINKEVFKVGCDVCRPLVEAARIQGHEVQVCDGLRLPYRPGCFDAVLSIAVIHHFSTKERRVRAVKEMARTLRLGGRIMIYVWAMEQKRRRFEKQDIFVPWNPQLPCPPAPRRRGSGSSQWRDDKQRKVRSTSSMVDEEEVSQSPRTQWFFSRSLDSVLDFGSLPGSRCSSRELGMETGEVEAKTRRRPLGVDLLRQVSSLFSSAASSRMGSEDDVFSPALIQSERNGSSTVLLPDLITHQRETSLSMEEEEGEEGDGDLGESFLRYYHVFREGELLEMIQNHVEELHVLQTYFDHANWCVVAEKV